ncbi:MAG: ATP synthase F1 subunit gamma [Clostridiales bacterium]|uniref:ATP synthase F1 subunit gamma n=1 Tax=Anaerosporobacter sp. TaxID=1872529 RepID=UPI001DF2A898|nr:ATP synthase F1 subunit gamma [Anaerosporobacter sp.]MBS5931260.1 ATP synthase F1 subunit gamma [Clostridiales bacterium]
MANAKEIKERMKSVQDTMKITNAMYMISSTKLRKSRKSLEDTEPYFFTLQSTMARILRHIPDMEDIYFQTKKNDKDLKVGYIVVTADKGMAGAYNHNVVKLAEQQLAKHNNTKLFVVGEQGRHYFEQHGVNIDEEFHYTVQNPTLHRARKIGMTILDCYEKHELDEVYIIYTKQVNAVQTQAEQVQLLPLKKADFKTEIPASIPTTELILRPSPNVVMDRIVPNYITGFIYGALVESYCSEQNSRMMAMEAATNSAKSILHELDILYNRVRQAAITQEITEVIGGAKAQKKKKKR